MASMTEIDFLLLIQSLRTDTLDALMFNLSASGDGGFIWLVLAALLVIVRQTRKAGLAILLALLVHFVAINVWLKPLFDRLRPCEILTIDNPLLQCLQDGSFPSGHTSAAFAATTVIFCANKRAGILALAFATLMGFSRLYLFVHYPSDVLVGALLGSLFGFVAYWLVEQKTKLP